MRDRTNGADFATCGGSPPRLLSREARIRRHTVAPFPTPGDSPSGFPLATGSRTQSDSLSARPAGSAESNLIFLEPSGSFGPVHLDRQPREASPNKVSADRYSWNSLGWPRGRARVRSKRRLRGDDGPCSVAVMDGPVQRLPVPSSSEYPAFRRDHWAVGRPSVRVTWLPFHLFGQAVGESSHVSWRVDG